MKEEHLTDNTPNCCQLECEKEAEFAVESKSDRRSYEDYTHCCAEHLPEMIENNQDFIVYRLRNDSPDRNKFEAIVRPVIKYLNENHHPHTMVIVEPTTAVLYEGVRSVGEINDYLKD